MRFPQFVAAMASLTVAATALPSQQSPASALDDPAIVGIFDAANSWDIATGTLASKRASRADVREFGAMLVRAHTVVQGEGRDLATRLHVTPTPVSPDFPLRKDYEETMKRLASLSGPAFDRAFLEHEVSFHEAVINAIKTTLLPAIHDAELKALVVKVTPAFKSHLASAEALLKKQP